jgi:hypothetical protein
MICYDDPGFLGNWQRMFAITSPDATLVKQNHDAIVRCIKADGVRVVNGIVEIMIA